MAWYRLKENHGMGEQNRRAVFLLDAAEDVSSPPEGDTSVAMGSVAFLADMTAFWVKDSSGTWTESTADALALLSLI